MSKFIEPADGTTVVVEVISQGLSLFTAITRNDANGEQGDDPTKNWSIANDDPQVDPGTWADWTDGATAVYQLGDKLPPA